MSAQKPFDYALARNNIVKLREIRLALETELDGAHMDLADLREQLDAMTRERDEAREVLATAPWEQLANLRSENAALRAQLAEAKREAFCAGWNDFAKVAKDFGLIEVPYLNENGPQHNWHIRGVGPLERFAKLYPAPSASAQEGTLHKAECWRAGQPLHAAESCGCNAPAPEPPQEVVVEVRTSGELEQHNGEWIKRESQVVRFTPEIVRQLWAMARAQEPTR